MNAADLLVGTTWITSSNAVVTIEWVTREAAGVRYRSDLVFPLGEHGAS